MIMRRLTAVVAGLAGVAVIGGVIAHYFLDQSSGDPGGRIIAQLQPTVAAVPAGAKILYRHDVEPLWDSCDGRAGTFGWDDVVVQVHFSTTASPDDILAHAQSVLAPEGWRTVPAPVAGAVTQHIWRKALDTGDGTVDIEKDSYGTSEWTLIAMAPPRGPRVSGC